MKKHFFMTVVIFLLLCSGLTARTIGNSAVSSKDTINVKTDSIPFAYSDADQMPEFVGGKEALHTFLAQNLIYPTACLHGGENGTAIKGRVTVRFIVDTDGHVNYATIVSSPHPALSEETLRIIKAFPPFHPGKIDGEPVATWKQLSIAFNAENEAKTSVGDAEKIYAVVEKPATFPGGEEALLSFISKNVRYPSKALGLEIQGVVKTRFVVNKEGYVEQIKIVESIHPDCDMEAVRVIKALPKFNPGIMKGEPVNSYFNLSIRFSIPTEENLMAAVFPGGNDVMFKIISKNLIYPESAKRRGVEGIIKLRFAVLENGKVGDVTVLKGLDPDCDREAIRVIKNLPRFIPGKDKNGNAMTTYFNIPIRFQLEHYNSFDENPFEPIGNTPQQIIRKIM